MITLWGPNRRMKPFILEGKAKGRSGCSQDAGAVDLSGDLACDQISVKTATAQTYPTLYLFPDNTLLTTHLFSSNGPESRAWLGRSHQILINSSAFNGVSNRVA